MTSKIEIKKTALLVIDVINSCCHEDCEIRKSGISFSKIRDMLPKLQDFIANYRQAGGNVIFINCVPWRKEFLPSNINELYQDPNCEYYSSGISGFDEKFFELSPEENDFVITKKSYDAFTS
jgi:nicotinamidase-related amidase